MRMNRFAAAALPCLLLTMVACKPSPDKSAAASTAPAAAASPAASVDAARIMAADKEPGSWMSTGRTYSEQRFSPLAQINDRTVGGLCARDPMVVAWPTGLPAGSLTGTSVTVAV